VIEGVRGDIELFNKVRAIETNFYGGANDEEVSKWY
jgi:hypothetical protein